MHSHYFLLAMAAMSHAWIFPSSPDLAPRSPWRTNLQRRDNPARGTMPPSGSLPDKTRTKMYCPKPDPNDQEATSKSMNTTALGEVEAQALKFCDPGIDIKSTVSKGGDKGHVFNAVGPDGKPAGPYVQLCVNLEDDSHWTCNKDVLSHMLDEIGCGSQQEPTQGFGTLVDDGQDDPEKYYVWYGNDEPGPCITASDFVHKSWDDVSKYYPSNNGDGGGGDGSGDTIAPGIDGIGATGM